MPAVEEAAAQRDVDFSLGELEPQGWILRRNGVPSSSFNGFATWRLRSENVVFV